MTIRPTTRRSSPRATAAVLAARTVNRLSRLLGGGSGTVIGGRTGLAVDPSLLAALARQRRVVLVTGTNGKTTTTGMLVAALTDGDGAVATNGTGSNMPAGHVAALIGDRHADTAVLEVDEGYLGYLIEETRPSVVVLLNLSRDQLDRIAEVRMLVDRWRTALSAPGPAGAGDIGTVVVANADDPMVTWAARAAADVRWVGAGQVWRDDAVGCPSCGGRIGFDGDGDWHCDTCDFARPERSAWIDDDDLVLAGDGRLPLDIGLPGRFNRANAAMVAVAAAAVPPRPGRPAVTVATALERLSRLGEVAGRFSVVRRRGTEVRLLLAKNPAGWTAILDLLDESDSGSPVVLSVNARVADGYDPSWLWDVPFERLAGRTVVAAGERCRDLAVRLHYAEVEHQTVEDPVAAIDAAAVVGQDAARPAPPVEFLGNYTAFATLRSRL